MRPRNFNGEGTVSDAGMWSTSSVVMRGSCRYSLMSLVYSSSSFCGCAGAAAAGVAALPFFDCALTGELADPYTRATARSALPAMAKRNFIIWIPPEGFQIDIALQVAMSNRQRAA